MISNFLSSVSPCFRVATNKLILLAIILVELAIIGGVVYIRFIKKKKY